MSYAFGIDFGTSNSGVAGISGPACQRFGDGGEPYPSIAAIEIVTDQIRSGRWVWERRAKLTEGRLHHVVASVKQALDTPQEWVSHGRRWTPEDVAAEILRRLKSEVQNKTGARMDRATVSIPVGFTPGKRQALRRAAHQAGIEVTAFISEATAALLRHLGGMQHCRYAAVFDWGGGTLDISVLSIRGETVEELATDSLREAGDDIDRDLALAVHAQEMARRSESIAFEAAPDTDRDLLITQCEKAKRALSQDTDDSISVQSYMGRQLQHRVTRAQFNTWISPRVNRAVNFLKETIRQVPLSVEALDKVVVTGGSSRLLLLRERLLDEFPTAEFSAEPEWDVAHGAAILQQNPGSYEMAESIGLVLSDGWFHPLLTEGSRPDNERRTVSLALVEDAREANLVLARRRPGDSGSGEVILSMNVGALGFDRERIDLSYKLSEDLALELEARSDALGRTAKGCFHGVRFTYRVGADGGQV